MNNYSVSTRAAEVIDGLKAKNARLEDQLAERTGERDRARNTAVELEQQLAAIQDELHRLEKHYEDEHYRTYAPGTGEALSAVEDCTTSVDVITDVLAGDRWGDSLKGSS